MHVELISTTKTNNKVIHGSENGKRTGCGINLSKPENIGLYTSIGAMNDVAQMTCEKCKTVIAKHLIRESNKEMAAQLKEEQKMLKKERAEAKGRGKNVQQPAPPRSSSPSSAGNEYVPPSMRRQMQSKQKEQPIEAPAPEAAKPISVPAPNAALPSVASMQSAATQRAGGDDVLAQFAMPGSAMTPPPAAPAGNDVLAQFAMPASAPAAMPDDDVLSQFAMPGTPPPSSQPPMRSSASDDVLSQFAMPTETPAMPAARPNQPDDVLSQFALPNVPSAVPNVPAGHPDAVTASNAEDLLANFNVPPAPAAPAAQPAAPIMNSPEDILAQFSVPAAPKQGSPASALDTLADTLFGGTSVPSAMPTEPVTPTVTVSETPAAPQRPLPSTAEILDVMPTPATDGLDAFTVPTAPVSAAPAAPMVDDLSSFTVPTAPVSAAPAAPTVDDLSSFTVPTAPVSASSLGDSLDDLLLMPGAGEPAQEEVPVFATVPSTPPVSADVPVLDVPQAPVLNVPRTPVLDAPASAPIVPDLTTVPNAPLGQTAAQAAVPVLDTPTAPPAASMIPPVNPVLPTGYGVPTVPTYAQPYAQPTVNPYAIPPQPKREEAEGVKPLFVGYSADGRQLFQTYDELGNPVPINEPVYSAPPETPKNGAVVPGTGAPIMDMDDLMASMGIQTKKQEAESQGKEIHYSEYHLPDKKKRPAAQKKAPASAQPDDIPKGPISAAEAKRRKKVEKINRDFEKQLRARGIDPRTGGIIEPKK